MRVNTVIPNPDFTLSIITDDGRTGIFDVTPYLQDEAFSALSDMKNFVKVRSGGYFIEWECGADLSADTLESHLKLPPLEFGRVAEAQEN